MSKDQFKVTPKFRTNSLHEKGGGSTITVHYKTCQSSKVYENIQYPEAYIKWIKECEDYTNGEIDSIVVDEGTMEHHTDNTDLPF